MKQIDKIIESQEAPKDKNVLWIKGDKLLSHVNGKWTPVGGGSSDNVQGGGSSSGGSEWRYMDLRQVSDSYRKYMLGYAHIISLTKDGSVYIGTSALSTADSGLTINAIGINMSAYMKDATNTGNQIITAADFWYKDMGGTLAWDGFMAEIGASELSEEGFLNIGA